MDGVDLHPGGARQHRRIATGQIDGANRLGLVRRKTIDERDQAAADLGLILSGGNRFAVQRLRSPRLRAITDRMADNAVEPGLDAFRVLKLVEVPGGPQQGVLEDVVGSVWISYPPADEGSEAIQIGQQTCLRLLLGWRRHAISPRSCAS